MMLFFGEIVKQGEFGSKVCPRLEDIATLSDENKSFIFRMIDMALRDLKNGQV